MSSSHTNGSSSNRIVYSAELVRPAIASTPTAAFQAAAMLSRHGTSAVRQWIEANLCWPEAGSPEDIALTDGVGEVIQYWQDEIGDGGFDPAEADSDSPARFDECDRLVIGWLADGSMPRGRELIFEMAWPETLAAIVKDAAAWFPAGTEKRAEQEEISMYRARRWMEMVNPFKDKDWLPRAEMYSSYSAWCRLEDTAGKAEPTKDFYAALKELGYAEAGRRGVRGFRPPRRTAP